MEKIPQRLKTKSNEWLAMRVMSLEDTLTKCNTERAELDRAFTSLSGLVMEQDPDKWAAWAQASRDPAAAEVALDAAENAEAERKMREEMSK
jgi:hypothetical protein